jgi:hypothetical protein
MKIFTLDEAQALVPVLESLLKRAMEAKEAAAALQEEMSDLGRRIFLSGGMRIDLAETRKRRVALEALAQRVKDSLEEIDSSGVQVKDLETGLLDFPCLLDGETVLLCWKRGEPRVEFWHRMEDGFRGRQPIDARFRRSEKMN